MINILRPNQTRTGLPPYIKHGRVRFQSLYLLIMNKTYHAAKYSWTLRDLGLLNIGKINMKQSDLFKHIVLSKIKVVSNKSAGWHQLSSTDC